MMHNVYEVKTEKGLSGVKGFTTAVCPLDPETGEHRQIGNGEILLKVSCSWFIEQLIFTDHPAGCLSAVLTEQK